MNKLDRNIVYPFLTCVLFILLSPSCLFSQVLSFDNAPINKVFKTLEEHSTYSFNFDPDFITSYFFTGEIDLSDFDKAVQTVLYNSPYAYEIKNNTVLIFEPPSLSYRVCGNLKDQESRENLIAATIEVKNNGKGTQSNEEGFFDFEIQGKKNQLIVISYLGYKPLTYMLQDLPKEDCPVYFMEIDKDLFKEEIIIKDYILDGISEGSDYGGFDLNFSQLSKNHSTVEHDILKTAQLLPGINNIDDSATNLQIRGSSADQNLILWEGAPIYNAGHIFGMISAFNPYTVDKVSIYKGAHDPQYDNRVGGIVDISLADSIDNEFHGSVGSTLTEAHRSLDIPIVKNHLHLSLAGRLSINNLYNSPTLQSYTKRVFQYTVIDDQQNDKLEGLINVDQLLSYSDWNAKALYQVTDRIKISVGTYQNSQRFSYSYSFPEDTFLAKEDINVLSNAVYAKLDLRLLKKWKSSLAYHSSRYSNENLQENLEGTILLDAYVQSNSIMDQSFTFSNNFNLSKAIIFKAGYELNSKSVSLSLDERSEYLDEFMDERKEGAMFQNLFFSLGYHRNKIRIDVGNRSTYYMEFQRFVNSPRINLQYSFNKTLKCKADAGIYHQFVSQLNSFGSPFSIVDNPLWILNSEEGQLSQKASKISGGLVYKNNGLLIDVDAYYNQIAGLTTLSPVLNLLGGNHSFSTGSSSIKGIDLLIKKQWAGFNTWLNYSYLYSINTFPDISETPFFSPFDIRHSISFVSSYKIKDLQFSLLSKYHSGLPYTIPEIKPNVDDPEPEHPFFYYLGYEEYNKNRLSDYIRLDLNINYRPNINKDIKAEISLSFINLLNRTNVFSQDYDLAFDEESESYRLQYIRQELLERTPLLMIRFHW